MKERTLAVRGEVRRRMFALDELVGTLLLPRGLVDSTLHLMDMIRQLHALLRELTTACS